MTQPPRAATLVLATLVLVAVLGACSSSGGSALGSHPLVRAGQPLADATVSTYDGRAVSLRSLRGRALVLNFWARSCAPCAEEMPTLQASYRAAPSDQVHFLGVDASEPESVGQPFARSLGVTYPLASDPKGTLVARLGVSSLPTTVFVDAAGTVRDVHVGRLSSAALASGLAAVGATGRGS
jgi:peroxiredoxin